MATDLIAMGMGEDAVDPTIPAPMTNVVEYGFEGRFEDWAEDARYFEYSKAANPIGSGHTSHVPIKSFGRDLTCTSMVRPESSRWTYPPNWASTAVPQPVRRWWHTSCGSVPVSRSPPTRTRPPSCTT
jgi:hypothetical protein